MPLSRGIFAAFPRCYAAASPRFPCMVFILMAYEATREKLADRPQCRKAAHDRRPTEKPFKVGAKLPYCKRWGGTTSHASPAE